MTALRRGVRSIREWWLLARFDWLPYRTCAYLGFDETTGDLRLGEAVWHLPYKLRRRLDRTRPARPMQPEEKP